VSRPWAAWLECGSLRFRITHPGNLDGFVKITSRLQALEFVRFFSSPETYMLFELGGMVEILPGEITEDADFNIADREKFEECCGEPKVTEIAGSAREYVVERFVVQLDGFVYAITETVQSSGDYSVVMQKRVCEASVLGIVHLGEF
jgi:hypothetical protein